MDFGTTMEYFRINRNIVECKLPCGDMADTGVPVLIETLWNVNK